MNLPQWTHDKKARLSVLWSEGKSGAEIGRELGFTRNAVIGMANRMGLVGKSMPQRASHVAPATRINVK